MKPSILILLALALLYACTRSSEDEETTNATIFIMQPIGIAYLVVLSEGEMGCGASSFMKTATDPMPPSYETVILDGVNSLKTLNPGTHKGRTLIGHKNTLLQADVTFSDVTATRLRGSYQLFAEDSTGARDTTYAPRAFIALKCPDYHPVAME